MRSYGAINLITMFWYTTRRWEAIKCIIPAWIRRFWMTLHVFQPDNYIWGPNVIALASAIAQAPITPLPKNHSKKHSLQQTLDDSIITSWLLLPTILIITQTTHLYHFSVLIGKLQPKEIWWIHLNLESIRQQSECTIVVAKNDCFHCSGASEFIWIPPNNLFFTWEAFRDCLTYRMYCFKTVYFVSPLLHNYSILLVKLKQKLIWCWDIFLSLLSSWWKLGQFFNLAVWSNGLTSNLTPGY